MSDWPFDDPQNTASFTQKQIMKEGEPILFVVRDDDDGAFQFLTGGELSTEDAMVVSLDCMLDHDPSLRDVAGLPPGGSATRASADAPWKWKLPNQDDLGLGARVESADDAWDEERYDAWTHEAIEGLRGKQANLEDVHGIGSYPRWDYDLDAATLTFSGDERDPLVLQVQVVGSLSSLTDTWLWGWENPSLPEAIYARTLEVRAFGQEHGLRELTVAKWKAEEADGWAMAGIAAHLLDGIGVYRAPTSNGLLFLVMLGVAD